MGPSIRQTAPGGGDHLRIQLTERVLIETAEGSLDESGLQRQARIVLAVLAAQPGRPVPRDEIAEAVWRTSPPQRWEKVLAAVVTRLRGLLADIGLPRDAIRSAFGCYVLELPAGARVDLADAEAHARDAEAALASGRLADAADAARSAAAIARRPFLPGEDGAWVEGHRTALRTVLQRCLDVIADAAEIDAAGAISAATESVALDPFRESSHRRLMRAHLAAGDRAAALRAYEDLRTMLADELGVEPSGETEAMYLEILRADGARAAAIAPPPERGGRLVGRADDIARLLALVARERCVTITGTGGVGKTRLALAVADEVARTGRAVSFADLTTVRDDAGVRSVVARAIGADDPGAAVGRIAEALDEAGAMLVLDNCEHVLEAVGVVVRTVLRASSGASVLATSRHPLEVDGEHVWDATPLPLPEPSGAPSPMSSPAVELFVDRARAADGSFTSTAEDLSDVVAICRMLDGLPLAIELAAARVRAFAPADIHRLVSARLDFLVAQDDATPPRHRTLRALLGWSTELLDADERSLLTLASAFVSPWTLDALAAIGGIDEARAADLVAALVDASLVMPVRTPDGTRYRLLDTVRAYAREGLDDEVRERHARWFAGRYVRGSDSRAFAIERDDVRAAIDMLIPLDPALALDALVATTASWVSTGLAREALSWIDAFERAGEDHADLWWCVATLAFKLGERDLVPQAYERMLERSRTEQSDLVRHLCSYGGWLCSSGRIDEGIALFQEAREAAEARGDISDIARTLFLEGETRASVGDAELGEMLQRRALELAVRHDLPAAASRSRLSLARLRLRAGRPAEALDLVQDALDHLRAGDDPAQVASGLSLAMAIAYELDRHEEADAFATEALAIVARVDDAFQRKQTLSNVGYLAAKRCEIPRARALLAEALDIARRAGLPRVGTLKALAELALVARDPSAALRAIEEATQRAESEMWGQPHELTAVAAEASLQAGDAPRAARRSSACARLLPGRRLRGSRGGSRFARDAWRTRRPRSPT